MLAPLDFNDTLSRLEVISSWLDTLGLTNLDRVRVYARNIRKMIEIDESGGMEALKATIPFEEAREVLWSYVESLEVVRAVEALRKGLGDELAAAPIEKALKGPADVFLETADNSDGRNFMFELIMCGRLAGAPAFFLHSMKARTYRWSLQD